MCHAETMTSKKDHGSCFNICFGLFDISHEPLSSQHSNCLFEHYVLFRNNPWDTVLYPLTGIPILRPPIFFLEFPNCYFSLFFVTHTYVHIIVIPSNHLQQSFLLCIHRFKHVLFVVLHLDTYFSQDCHITTSKWSTCCVFMTFHTL